MIGHGWLSQNPDIPRLPDTLGIWLEPSLPTRWEELTWALRAVQATTPIWSTVLDAGTGFEPGIHIWSEVLAHHDYDVIAVDSDARTFNLPTHPRITRLQDDLRAFRHIKDGMVHTYTSISVIEHLNPNERPDAWREAFRVLKPGGHLIATVDEAPPHELANEVATAGFSVGGEAPFTGNHLNPRVAWHLARKPQ